MKSLDDGLLKASVDLAYEKMSSGEIMSRLGDTFVPHRQHVERLVRAVRCFFPGSPTSQDITDSDSIYGCIDCGMVGIHDKSCRIAELIAAAAPFADVEDETCPACGKYLSADAALCAVSHSIKPGARLCWQCGNRESTDPAWAEGVRRGMLRASRRTQTEDAT